MFGCNHQISFCHFFFTSFYLVHFLGLKAYRHWVYCESYSIYSFTWIFLKLCSCFCKGLKIRKTFSCNPQIQLCYLFSQFLPKHLGTGYLVNATALIILPGSF